MGTEYHRSSSRASGRRPEGRADSGTRLTWTLVGAALGCVGLAAWLVFGPATQTNAAGGALLLLGLGLVVSAIEVTRGLRRESANADVLRCSQQAVVLLEALAVSVNGAVSIDAALQVCLDRVCQYTGWLVGHAYVSDGGDEITASPVWHLDHPDRFGETRQATEKMRFKTGEGGVGRAFAIGRPVVCSATDFPVCVISPADAEAIAYQQHALAESADLVNVVALPIVVDGAAMAVLEFFSSTPVVFDDQLSALMANVTARLARVVERDRAAAQLIHQTLHDPLTGLANRVLLSDRLSHALARLSRQLHPMAVLFVDVDNFKVINDSLGHDRGDHILVQFAERLAKAVRIGDTVARFGGDEFVVLCEQLVGNGEALAIAERVRQLAAVPIEIDGRVLIVTASVGIAITRSPGAAPADLLRDADAAMYQAKLAGRDRSVIFADSMRARAVIRLDTELALRRAIAQDELRLHYQPIVNIKSGRTEGVEALVRWQHPTRGLIYPDQFISIAEETGLIIPLGEWVLGEACRQMHTWHLKHDQLADLSVSVNLSGHQLTRPEFTRVVAEVLSGTGLAAGNLTLEITESVLMADAEAAVKVLRALKALGVQLSVDDFGTGYSSLSYLRKFPVDALKIDKSFVDGLGIEAEDSAIVHAIINLAHTLKLKTVAEGTETAKQLTALTDLGCDQAQGYFLSRPKAPADLVDALLHPLWSGELTALAPSGLAPSGLASTG
jgi:diguanylate cyclase (GGDEF)-like protein